MTKEPSTLNFSEKERICETNFISSGPYWHICTDGTKMQAVFRTKHELDTAMWMLAKATCKTPEVHLITFEIMDNHIHLIAAGRLEDCIRMFETFRISIKKVVHRSGNIVDWKNFKATYIKIESLSALRNENNLYEQKCIRCKPELYPVLISMGRRLRILLSMARTSADEKIRRLDDRHKKESYPFKRPEPLFITKSPRGECSYTIILRYQSRRGDVPGQQKLFHVTDTQFGSVQHDSQQIKGLSIPYGRRNLLDSHFIY